MPFTEQHDETGQRVQVQLEGYATVLQDDIVAAEFLWTNQPVIQILTDILAYQSTPRIALGVVDSSLNALLSFRVAYDNLMKACWDVRNVVGGYISVDGRKLNLRANPGTDIGERIQQGWNLRAIGKTTDATEAVTKLYPLGRGEGNNQQRPSSDLLRAQPATFQAGSSSTRATLTITAPYSRYKGWTGLGGALPNGSSSTDTRVRPLTVLFGATNDSANWEQGANERTIRSKTNNYSPPAGTPTLNYVHADYLVADDTIGTYGVLARVYTDKRFEASPDLIKAVQTVLDTSKLPRVSYAVKAADLARIYPSTPIEQLSLYDQVNVVDSVLNVATKLRIMKVRYQDVFSPDSFALTVGLLETIPPEVRLQTKVQQAGQMPDGGTNLWVSDIEDNVDPTHPYTRQIYIPQDAVVVNKVTINLQTLPYRYYVSTTAAESSHTHALNFALVSTDGEAAHTHSDPQGGSTGAGSTHGHTYFITLSTSGTGSVHLHAVTPGIVETTTPSTMELKVDGVVASASATFLTDFDLTPYLVKDADGRIVRGWHTLTFTPNTNGRIQAAIVHVVFIQSRGVVAG